MLESNSPNPAPLPAPPVQPTPEVVDFAKFPPDDDDLPAAPPAGGGAPAGGGSFDMGDGDGDFKKGRFNPWVILVGVVAVLGLGVFLAIGVKQDADKLTIEQAVEQEKAIFVLPKAEQIPKWREWAKTDRSNELRSEALKQLAWAKDPEGVALAIKGLTDLDEPIQGISATALAEYGRPMGEPARDALLQALNTAGAGAKPQIAWALVELGEARAFDKVMELYRIGHLSRVQRLDGVLAFDPNKIVELVSLDKLAALAGDQSAAVRQLVATVLSRNAEPKWTDPLIKLVKDEDPEVARQAAPGLGKIGDERAREPLLSALGKADKESREKYLVALRDGIGAQGLVLSLFAIDKTDDKRRWYQTKQIMEMLRKTADPRVGDHLAEWLEKEKPSIHWETESGIAMAEVGDLRAVPILSKRLKMDPLKIYSDQYDWEMALKRDDNERVVASRMLADLAALHPDKRADIRKQAEDSVMFWIHEMPSPHANGLRALAAMESTKDIEAFRKWANPNVPLPKEGQQPPMPEEWVIAQSAMRYVGWLKDEPSRKVLDRALTAKPKELDVTMDGLYAGGLAILGMSLRAIGVGAAHGLSQWRDPKAFKPLFDYIDDVKNNEQSRMEACAALAWVATDKDFEEVSKKIEEYGGELKSDQFRRACLLEALIQRPIPGIAPTLMKFMVPEAAVETRHQVARAIAKSGFDAEVEKQLFEMLKDDALVNDAALALILGGTPETAARAVAWFATLPKPKPALEMLGELWYKSFGYWSNEDLEKGLIFKYIDNAEAISRVEINQTPQEWATVMLSRQLDNLDFDNGPHSFTRVVMRVRLNQMAKGDDQVKRDGAVRALKFMREQGSLIALRDEKGAWQPLAAKAYHEYLNPKAVTGVKLPDDDQATAKQE